MRIIHAKAWIAVAAVALVTTVVTAQSPARRRPQAVYVTVKAMQFSPSRVVVHVGDTVVWKNADVLSHSATSATKLFDTREIKAGTQARWVVRSSGSLNYMCIFHPTMKGVIIADQAR